MGKLQSSWKSHPLFPSKPPSKSWGQAKPPPPPFFENLVGGSTSQQKKGGGCTLCWSHTNTHTLTYTNTHKYTHKAHSTFKVLVSMKVSDNPFFKTTPLFYHFTNPSLFMEKIGTPAPFIIGEWGSNYELICLFFLFFFLILHDNMYVDIYLKILRCILVLYTHHITL